MANVWKYLGAAAGFLVGGPVGAAVGYGAGHVAEKQLERGSSAESRGRSEIQSQKASYESQLNQTRMEQKSINERISASQAQVQAGAARANRARGRGGVFGDMSGQSIGAPTNPRLG